VDEAREKFFASVKIPELEADSIPLSFALGRILAEDVIASTNVPPFDRAAMDGYAVVAEDTFGASQTNPIILKLVGSVQMGSVPGFEITRGTAASIPTGGPMPKGANAVVMLEYTKRIDDKVEVYVSIPVGDNVSLSGEDVRRGEPVLHKGTRLKPQDLGILASLGMATVKVLRHLKVGILSTGNELVDVGQPPGTGKIIDANRTILSAWARELGCEAIDLGIARDDEEEIRARLSTGLETADLLLVSGGTSVGAGDLVPEVINKLGNPGMVVHGVSMRPAYPTGLASVDGKPVILLSGYPVAAMIGFYVFARPLIHRMQGSGEGQPQTVLGRLLRRIPSPGGMRTFARVVAKRVNGEIVIEPLRVGGSGMITTMIKANGMVVIPEDIDGYETGEEVEVILFRPLEAG